MVTVEAAIAIGSLVAVLAVVLAAVGAVVAEIRCVDAAGEAARRASRDDTAGAEALARELPSGTEVRVEPDGDLVHVVVRVPPLGGALPGLRLAAEAVAAREPAVAAPTGDPADTAPDAAPDPAPGPGSAPAPDPEEPVP
ncbi:TadE family type IV pilus minor pilin [Actinomycetospora sp. TBRC 11914]|uniref:TadE family type IV pilus minor pilin n=1 Tax=Actinomycetospora sp. TBRC 11914 TaxID=2729387 RepID=UPI001B7D4F78|nr:TadE family type IV pilus minor pilin [Actinomycetospora sp. TBRC 11914]